MNVASVLTCLQAQRPLLLDYLARHQRGEIQPPQLHAHQIDALFWLVKYFDPKNSEVNPNGEKTALVVLPTGCGKTGVAILASYALADSRVLVVTPSMIISEQVREAYQTFLLRRGIISKEQSRMPGVLPSICMPEKTSHIRHAFSSNVMIINPHKIGGQSKVPIEDVEPTDYDLVIVDEAHHYPATTWSRIIDHFSKSKLIFLTATPWHNGKPIIDKIHDFYELERRQAVRSGIIRDIDELDEVPPASEKNLEAVYELISDGIRRHLDKHDAQDKHVTHQAMVLAQTKEGAEKFCKISNDRHGSSEYKCEVYVGKSPEDVRKCFVSGKVRTLIVVGRLQEGFDHNKVSVVGIIRKIAPSSRVLFAQFIGRAVRKAGSDDTVKAQVVTHRYFNQRGNYDTFEQLAKVDPCDPDDLEDAMDKKKH